jgi:hypothetical protein
MNMSEENIERTLRSAPRPEPPKDLKQKLLAEIELPASSRNAAPPWRTPGLGGWLRRWWPALVPASVSLACAGIVALQQAEIQDVKKTLQALTPVANQTSSLMAESTAQSKAGSPASDQNEELARLRDQAARLRAEVTHLEQLQTENAQLRTQLAQPVTPTLSPEDAEALAKAKENAQATECVNHLKQLGLAVKVWALDNQDTYPQHVLEMTNEMSTPKILVCPADTAHQAPADWSAWTTANMSYEYLAAGGSDTEPQRVMFRCPIHGSITLCDGSVQRVGKKHPEFFVERDGKLYYEPRPVDSITPNQNPPGATPSGTPNP